MAKATRLSMIVERFITFNLDRYADDAIKLPLFTGLTEEDLVFEDMVLATLGKRVATVRSPTRSFVGYNQRWTAAEINDPHAFQLTEEDPIPSKAIALNKSDPGVYLYEEGDDFKILILIPRNTPEANKNIVAVQMFKDALLFETLSLDVTVSNGAVTINAPCMWGSVSFDLAASPIVQIGAKEYGQLTHPEDLVL